MKITTRVKPNHVPFDPQALYHIDNTVDALSDLIDNMHSVDSPLSPGSKVFFVNRNDHDEMRFFVDIIRKLLKEGLE